MSNRRYMLFPKGILPSGIAIPDANLESLVNSLSGTVAQSTHRRRNVIGGAVGLTALLLGYRTASAQETQEQTDYDSAQEQPDFDIALTDFKGNIHQGHYWSQTGYGMIDRMWETFQSFGGAEVLGLPVSREFFGDDGWTIEQALQRGHIKYNPITLKVNIAHLLVGEIGKKLAVIPEHYVQPHAPDDIGAYASIESLIGGGNEGAVSDNVSATIDTDYGGIRIIGPQHFLDKIIGALDILAMGDGGIWDIVGIPREGDGTAFDYVRNKRRVEIIFYDSPLVDLPGVDGDSSSSIALAYRVGRKIDGVSKTVVGFPYLHYIEHLEARPPIVTAQIVLYEALRSNVAPRSVVVKELRKLNPAVGYTLEDQREDQFVRHQIAEAVINEIGNQTGLFTYKSPFDSSPSRFISPG